MFFFREIGVGQNVWKHLLTRHDFTSFLRHVLKTRKIILPEYNENINAVEFCVNSLGFSCFLTFVIKNLLGNLFALMTCSAMLHSTRWRSCRR